MTPEIEARLKAASITERNRAIRDAHEAGASYHAIARIVGLTAPGVRKIVLRNQKEQP